jgi:general secretion pathway protein D
MRRALALLALAGLVACASSSAFLAGERAERRQDYDHAVLEYARALKEDPDNQGYRRSLGRARLRASQEHATTARRLAGRGLRKEALDEFRLALDLDPRAVALADEARDLEARLRSVATAPSLRELKEKTRERALGGLALPPEAQQPLGLHFRGAGLRECYQALGRTAGVNFVFDAQVPDTPIQLDLRDASFEQALGALAAAGRTFHRVLDGRTVTVVPDTPQKRREYEQQVVKTLFLSNADLKETIDLLRVVLGARRVAPLPGANALTINDSPDKVAAAERIVEALDKKRAEVVVEVEILEVNRGRLQDYGIELSSTAAGGGGITGGIFPNPFAALDEKPYSRANLVVTGLPGVIYRLLRNDSSTRLLANPQLRASEGQTAQARFGDQVPVPVTTFSPLAGGGIAQQPVTSYEYKNVGVNIDLTPRVHQDGEITLSLKLDISSVGAPGYQGLPTFNSRQVTSVIRLRDGETNILAGLISEIERKAMTGIPGLASVPLLGRLFARNKTEVVETDILMTLTPHVVRRPELTEEDLRSFTLGVETSPLLFEVPTVPPAGTPLAPPRPTPEPRIEPVRPPSPSPAPTPAP